MHQKGLTLSVQNRMTMLHDMHCHLDFMTNGEQVAEEARAAGTLIFANTVEPGGFDGAIERFGNFDNVSIGLGFHPWWMQEETLDDQLNVFEMRFESTRFIGEVGLDFGRRGKATADIQVAAFTRIAQLCGSAGGKLLSLHAVRSAETVLDILERTGALANCTCIFHWFSDTSVQLLRARRAGCFFSINPMMASTGRGREYIKAIETDRLLLEADAPPEQGMAYSYGELHTQLEKAAEAVASSHGPDALATIAATAEHLLGRE